MMQWYDVSTTKFGPGEATLMFVVTATIQGMTTDRHTFTGNVRERGRLLFGDDDEERNSEFGKAWDTDSISEGVQAVLTKYDDKAETLKKAYQAMIQKRDDFR